MAIKAVNNTAGPNGLVPTLLVFGAYPRITSYDAPVALVAARANVIKATIANVYKCYTARQVADALRARNGPKVGYLQDLPLNVDVIV
jgi:hypothetical protein